MSFTDKELSAWERRSLIKAFSLGGIGALAGCLGDEDTEPPDDVLIDPDDPDRDIEIDDADDTLELDDIVDPRNYTIEGHTLRIPGAHNPEETHFISQPLRTGHNWAPEEYSWDTQVLEATNEWSVLGLWPQGAFWDDPGEIFPVIYEDVTLTEELLRLEIRDDVYWQDGEPITAKDGLFNISSYGFTPHAPGESLFYGSQLKESRAPDGFDGKVIEMEVLPVWLRESRGWLSHQPGFIYNFYLGPHSRMGGVRHGHPAHIWPYDEIFERVWELEQKKYEVMEEHPELWDDYEQMKQHQEQDEFRESLFDEWWRENMPEEDVSEFMGGGAFPWMSELLFQVIGDDDESRREFIDLNRDPDWYTGHGLYELDEIVGTEGYSLVPNEEHRKFDEHTFDEIFIEWTEEEHRERAAVMAEHLDYADVPMSPEMTDELPDSRSQITYPDEHGYVVSLNHLYWPGDSHVVRHALMHATNRADLAENIHPDTAAPIMTPGWDHWGAHEFMDESWAEDHLTTYEYDLDRAAELLEQAGYERIDGYWHDADGERIEEIIATPETAPVFEETLADQWQDFGIDISVQTMDEASFWDRWEGSGDPAEPGHGDFAVASGPSTSLAGWLPDVGAHFRGISHIAHARARHWYGVDTTEEIMAEEYRPSGYGTGYGWERLRLEIPPAGEPDSDERVPFAASWAHLRVERGPADFVGDNQPVQEGLYEPDRLNVENLYQAYAWAMNWLLVDLPMVRSSGQLFLNTDNFRWGEDVSDIEGLKTPVEPLHELWDFFGSLGGPHYYAGTNLIWANPERPKDGASVRET